MHESIKLSCWGCASVFRYQHDLEDNEHIAASTTDRYGVASPECSNAYLRILAKEYSEWQYPAVNRLTIDAYCVQHPPRIHIQQTLGIDERLIAASRQSVAIHLIGLYLALEKKRELPTITAHMKHILDSGVRFEDEELAPPANLGSMKITDIIGANTLNEHTKRVWQWADASWQAWAPHHKKVREWHEKYG